jgi:DNA modification methylase
MNWPVCDWNFNGAKTKQTTHCFHVYPAMMIPQIARRVIKEYLEPEDKVVLDPYCGSGTSLVEANISGRSAIGIDINPLARMIAKAKLTLIDDDLLESSFVAFSIEQRAGFPHFDQDYPQPIGFDHVINNVREIDFWFPPKATSELLRIKHFIEGIVEQDIQQFFKIAFSETIRDVSYINKGGYKRHRMKGTADFHPDTCGLMLEKLERNKSGLANFAAKIRCHDLNNEFYDFNTIHTIEPLRERQIDAVVTSPPYGDSRTTVAYGEFSSLALQWLGYPAKEAKRLDNTLMGGAKQNDHSDATFPNYLRAIISNIKHEDADRSEDITAFYSDYSRSIGNVAQLIKPGGYAAYVVGNRIVKHNKLPTDKITEDFFKQHGYHHVTTIERSIPSKRMPRSNSPTNETGKTVSTMNEEYIVVMQKDHVSSCAAVIP